MKLVLDIIMLIFFLLEINHNLTGQQFHEIAGVVLAVLVIVHLICNRRWFVSIVQNQNWNWKKRTLVFVNLLLLFSFVGLMTSGVMISGYLLPNVTLVDQRVWSEIHHLLINAIEILGALHVLMHIRSILNCVKNKKNIYITVAGVVSCFVIAGLLVVRFIDWKQDNREYENAIDVKQQEVERASEMEENKEDLVETTDGRNIEKETTEVGNVQSNSEVGILEISFDFKRARTPASNQYAVWIEDTEGNVVRTIYASNFTANGGYKFREDSIPTWVEHANLSGMSSGEIDAVSGATPSTGKMIYEWDGTDDKGDKLSSGKYMFYVEGTLYWSSIVTLSGTVEFGGNEDSNIDVQTIYTEDTKDNRDMIQNVSARYYIREKE